MNQNQNPNNRIVLYGMATAFLFYMFTDVVKAFIIGGEGAPDIWVFLASLVVLGGGSVFAGVNFYKMYQQQKQEKANATQEETQTAKEEA